LEAHAGSGAESIDEIACDIQQRYWPALSSSGETTGSSLPTGAMLRR
jgi:hypothetical protein